VPVALPDAVADKFKQKTLFIVLSPKTTIVSKETRTLNEVVLCNSDLGTVQWEVGYGESESRVAKLWSEVRVGCCRFYACLWRPLVLGKSLNICGQGKASVVLVGLLPVISQRGMDVKGWVVGAGVTFGQE